MGLGDKKRFQNFKEESPQIEINWKLEKKRDTFEMVLRSF
jgi:hypothetical protein